METETCNVYFIIKKWKLKNVQPYLFSCFTGQIAADFKSSYTFLVLKHSSAINFLMMLKNTVVLVDYNSLGPLFNNCIRSSSLDTSKIYGTLNISATRSRRWLLIFSFALKTGAPTQLEKLFSPTSGSQQCRTVVPLERFIFISCLWLKKKRISLWQVVT